MSNDDPRPPGDDADRPPGGDATADDGLLIRLIGEAFDATVPPPGDLEDFARSAHRLVLAEAELAEISDDSLVSARYRGDERRLRFVTPRVVLELEVVGTSIMGRADGVDGLDRLVVESAAGTEQSVPVDSAGMFELAEIPTGPVRLRVPLSPALPSDETDDRFESIVTEWVVLRSRP